MKNLVIITSVIDTPNKPLSYTYTRSVFTREERFNDTKKTVESIKKFIPNCEILLIECSNLNETEEEYFNNNCSYFINLWNKYHLHSNIFGISKSLGEGTMTIEALNYIIDNNIQYDNLFKISGRYWINDSFNYGIFDNNHIVFLKIENSCDNIATLFYKIPKYYSKLLLSFLNNNLSLMHQCVGYEIIFGHLAKTIDANNIKFYDTFGISGRVSVCGTEGNW